MHPFTGTSVCPRCSKAVYAAEQVMGPGRKLYHKPCLACTMCNKRLDSLTLLEHNYKPYCKLCHVKHFGTKDLRQANLPYRSATASPPPPLPPSPLKNGHAQSSGSSTPGSDSVPPDNDSIEPSLSGAEASNGSAAIPQASDSPSSEAKLLDPDLEAEERDTVPPSLPARITNFPTSSTDQLNDANTSATLPLPPTRTGSFPSPVRFTHRFSSSLDSSMNNRFNSATMGRSQTIATASAIDYDRQSARPLIQTATGGVVPIISTNTGTRYGAALGGNVSVNTTGSPTKRWSMGANPSCPKCGKTVYFAEQVKAIGKTYHKGCLRCTQCNTSLDSTRLTEKDGEPFCRQCYSKLHGPRGSGYALLGKAGG